jgi:hypothetical protein
MAFAEKEVSMETALSWLRHNPSVRDDVVESFQSDSRLQEDALPDAVAADPTLLVDIAKGLVCEAVRRDAPEGVPEELLVAVRRMAAGESRVSPYMRTVLKNLRGLREPSELEPVLRNALAEASDEDRPKLESMIDLVKNPDIVATADAKTLPSRPGFSPVDCVACCSIGCVICTEACPLCCVVGCLYCG